jgi:hypothetical protein
MEGLRSVITDIWCDENRVATVVFADGMAALQIKGGKIIQQGHAVPMFDSGNFASLRVPEHIARAVHERINRMLVQNGMPRCVA